MKKLYFLGLNILMVCLLFGLAGVSFAALPGVMKTSPADGQTGVSLVPTLQWQKVSGVNAYEVRIKNYPGSIIWDYFINDVASKKLPAEVLQIDKSYEWCVRAVKTPATLVADRLYTIQEMDAFGMTDISPECTPNSSFTEIKAGEYDLFSTAQAGTTLKTPTISSPKGLTTFPLILKWSSAGTSVKYEWRITGTKTETLSNGEIVISAVTGLPSGKVSITQVEVADPSNSLSILEKYAYTWQVRTCTADYSTCGQWASASFSLTLKKFHLVSPKNNTPTATVVKLDWEDVPGAASYRVVGEGFDPVNVSKNESFTTISGLVLDATYRWYVVAKREGKDFLSEEQNWSFTPRSGSTPPATTYTLTVKKSGAGTGTVTSNPDGISCGDSCAAPYTSGTSITLTAVPDADSTFAGWLGQCSGKSTCTLSMTAVKTVTANFTVGAIEPPPSGSVPAPQLSSPRDGATGVSIIPTFTWRSVTGANLYQLEVWGFPLLSTRSTSLNTGSSQYLNEDGGRIIATVGDTTYQWRVQASKDNGATWGEWSSYNTFTTKKAVPSGGDGDGNGSGNGGIFSGSAACQSEASDCPEGQICNPLKYKSVECLVEATTNFLIKLSIPVAVIMFVISGIMFVISVGDPEKIRTARRVAIYTAVGFAVILVASGLIKVLQSLLGGP